LNPDLYIFDFEALDERRELIVKNRIPYSDVDNLSAEEIEKLDRPLEFSHSMSAQVGGQVAAGFAIIGWAEAPQHHDATAEYMPGYFATRAVKR
jgi:hypothetical protein